MTEPVIQVLAVGPYDNRSYVLSCPSTGKAVIIDAADEAARIIDACARLEVAAVLTTHGHSDHIAALDEVQAQLHVPFHLHPADSDIAGRKPEEPLAHRQEIAVGEVNLHVLHTPGHTPGSVCFVVESGLFSGDTLFPGGPGATRWDYSSFGQIMDSIEQRLMTLPDATIVYPGHGLGTTIGTERPQLASWRVRGW